MTNEEIREFQEILDSCDAADYSVMRLRVLGRHLLDENERQEKLLAEVIGVLGDYDGDAQAKYRQRFAELDGGEG